MNALLESFCLIRLLHRVGTVALLREAKLQLNEPDQMFSRVMEELEHREVLERRAMDERWSVLRGLRESRSVEVLR